MACSRDVVWLAYPAIYSAHTPDSAGAQCIYVPSNSCPSSKEKKVHSRRDALTSHPKICINVNSRTHQRRLRTRQFRPRHAPKLVRCLAMEKFLREWRQDALNKAQYDSAIFIGDKLLALTSES